MESIADSDHQKAEDAALDPGNQRGARAFGVRPSGKVPWTAWVGFGGNWLAAPDSYWRRRFLILAGGLAVLGLITWGASALLGPAKPILRAGAAQAADNRKPLPAAAYGPPATASTTPAPAGSNAAGSSSAASSSPGTSPASSAATPGGATGQPSSAPAATPTTAAAASPTAGSSGGCPPGSIVLSLFTGKPQYGPGEQPRFTVYVVSTAQAPCQIAYTPPFTHVVVTRNGQVVWDSAACGAAGGAARSARLTPGVPTVVMLSWDRKAPGQGCAGSAPAGTTGPLAAVAMADGKSSPIHWFTLTR